MMISLSKNKQLNLLQILIIGFVFGAGLFPEKVSAVKCYSCEGPDCKSNYKTTTKTIDCDSGHCETRTEGDSVKRACGASTKNGECIEKEFPGGCYNLTEENKNKLTTCKSSAAAGESDGAISESGNEGTSICSCSSDLCNGNDNGIGNNQNSSHGGGSGASAREGREGRAGKDTINCYKCEGKSSAVGNHNDNCARFDSGNAPGKVECSGLCFKETFVDKDNNKVVWRGCDQNITEKDYSCFREFQENHCIETSSDPAKVSPQASKFKKCIETKRQQHHYNYGRNILEEEDNSTLKKTVCRCDNDLCNFSEHRPSISKQLLIVAIAYCVVMFILNSTAGSGGGGAAAGAG